MTTSALTDDANYYLDITGEVCPLTFVKTKLLIEKMASGEVCEVRLRGAEPLANVPRSVRELGHLVLSLQPEPGQPEDGVHRLRLRKA
ncbi:MAG: sulfurtransferase TusA family protein [Rhodospirillales bacterium]|nr:sulfurtransferase TusA family protein [Rhodospirillales bacterium]